MADFVIMSAPDGVEIWVLKGLADRLEMASGQKWTYERA
jgi:hypothetical protein